MFEPAEPASWVVDATSNQERDIKVYVGVVWKHKVLVTFIALLVAGFSVAWSLNQTERYRATATVLLQGEVNPATGTASTTTQRALVETELEIMRSSSIRTIAEEKVGHPISISFRQQGESQVIAFVATSTDAAQAAKDATTYGRVYIDARRQARLDDLLSTVSELETRRQEVRADLDEIQQPINDINTEIAVGAGLTPEARQELVERRDALDANIRSSASSLEAQIISFDTLISQAQTSSSLSSGAGGQIISEAAVPGASFEPKVLRNAVLGLVVGLMLGLVVAIVRDQFDERVRSESDVGMISAAPMLGSVPAVRRRRHGSQFSLEQPDSAVSEAHRALRVMVQFLVDDQQSGQEQRRVIQVTSSLPSEGKSTTVANLGLEISRAGNSVLMVSADLRQPSLERFFEVEPSPGLSDVLLGQVTIGDAIRPIEGAPRLYILPCGPIPADPSVLLDPRRTKSLFDQVAEDFDYVLVDGPPVLPVSDALLLSVQADWVICVARSGRVTRHLLRRTLARLQQVDAKPMGVLLTGVRHSDNQYGYGYGYGYGHGGPKPPRRHG